MGKGGVGDAGGSGEWMARTFRTVAPRTGRTSTIRQFWRSLRHGEGRGGGMPVGVGSGCRELSIQLLRGRAYFPYLCIFEMDSIAP